MHTNPTRACWKPVSDQHQPFARLMPARKWFGAERTRFTALLLWSTTLSPGVTCSQSLNDAVNTQLEFASGQECNRLLAGDAPGTVLTGGLLGICTRGAPAGGAGSSSAAGGNAATPITLPGVVEKRMGTSRDDEESAGDRSTVAELARGLNIFASAEYESLDRDMTHFEDGYDSDIWRLTLGADLQPTQRTVAGLALDVYRQDGNFDKGGNFDANSYGIIAFGSWLPTDRTFLQGHAEYAFQPNNRTRVANFTQLDSFDEVDFTVTGRPDADFDANQYSGGVLLGYDYVLENVTIGPRAALDGVYTDYEGYEEKKNNSGLSLGFNSESETSIQSSLGLQGSVAVSTGFGVVTSQAGVSWKHEYANDQRNVDAYFVEDTRQKKFKYQTEPPDRDFFEYNFGMSLVLPRDIQTFVNYRVINGHKYFDNQAVTIGARMAL